jgi:hypothetical protein
MPFKQLRNPDGSPAEYEGEPIIDNWSIDLIVETVISDKVPRSPEDLPLVKAVRAHSEIATVFDPRRHQTWIQVPAFTWDENSALFGWIIRSVTYPQPGRNRWSVSTAQLRELRVTINNCTTEEMARQFLPIDEEEDSYDERYFATLRAAGEDIDVLIRAIGVRYRRFYVDIIRHHSVLQKMWDEQAQKDS